MKDVGNAVVEFVAVVPLLFGLGLGVLETVLTAHAQSIVTAAAAEAAAVGAVSVDPERAALRAAEDVIRRGLGRSAPIEIAVRGETARGLPVLQVEVALHRDLLVLPQSVTLTGNGSSLWEGAP